MQSINIYYIGIMYFFVVYTSSLARYRESGKILIIWAGFFIWVQYLWSLFKGKFEQDGDTFRIFTMVTLQKLDDVKDVSVNIEDYQDI